MVIGLTPISVMAGEPVRLYSHKVGLCEWHVDGGQIVGQLPDNSIMVAWQFPGPKHVVLIQRGDNGQQHIDRRTIIVV